MVKKNYYLDTSVLRGGINQLISNSKYTSIYVTGYNLTELISQINEGTYNSMQILFHKIDSSLLKIDWRLPEDVICKCYNLKNRYCRIKIIKKIFNAVLKSKNFQEFLGFSEFRNLNFISSYDNLFAPEDHKFQAEENLEIAKEYERIFRKSHKGENYRIDLLSDDMVDYFAQRNIRSLLFYVLGNVTKTTKNEVTINQCLKIYNGKLETYHYAFSFFKLSKYSAKSIVGRNDYNDLMHLVYLNEFSENKFFLYNDKIYSGLGDVSKSKLIKFDEFVNLS